MFSSTKTLDDNPLLNRMKDAVQRSEEVNKPGNPPLMQDRRLMETKMEQKR